ncbi:2613_t:CDS:2, partial [Gigaspora rosea]
GIRASTDTHKQTVDDSLSLDREKAFEGVLLTKSTNFRKKISYEPMKIQQYFDFVSSEENENEGTIEERIAKQNQETIKSSNYSNNCEEILRPPNQEIQTTLSNSCELNALEAGMERYQTSWKKICEEYAVLCNRNPGQLKDKARNEKFRRSRIGIEIGLQSCYRY